MAISCGIAPRADLPRLSKKSLSALASRIVRPSYDRSAVSAGIVHIGLGAFCRAHLAVYTDDVLASGARDWGIVGVNPRSPLFRGER